MEGSESRLQAAECARFWAGEEVPGHPPVRKLLPAKAGTPNPSIDLANQIHKEFVPVLGPLLSNPLCYGVRHENHRERLAGQGWERVDRVVWSGEAVQAIGREI